MAVQTVNRIVVGLCASSGSRCALKWAAQRALESEAELLVVTALADPRPMGSAGGMQIPFFSTTELESVASEWQHGVIAEVLGGGELSSSVTAVVEIGGVSWVLLRRAAHADLLVLGASRRRLGSTVRRCVRKSRCPVVVIESDRPA